MLGLDCNLSANVEKLTSDANQAKEKKYRLDHHGLDQLGKLPVHQVRLGKLCFCYLIN